MSAADTTYYGDPPTPGQEIEARKAWRALRIGVFAVLYAVSLICGVLALAVEPYRYSFIPGNEHHADGDVVLGGMIGAGLGLLAAVAAVLLFVRSWKAWILVGLLFVLSGAAMGQLQGASSDIVPVVTEAPFTSS
uniref:hypothetical protein n=1 Tax=Herbidospora sakaeratensis TaxID=564415 RepID=UPI0007825503|nr:hypothetical protein [Herbidospora sakaeratensis]